MPRVVYRHENVSRFIVSAIGQPGEREFFIQVKSDEGINTIAVEKEQVRVLSEQINNLIVEVRRSGMVDKAQLAIAPRIDKDPLEIPIEADFRLGIASIAWKNQLIEITFQAISSDDFILLDDIDDGPDLVVANLSVDLAKGFCLRADDIVTKGRSACPFCGLPINLSGHLCPRANGYRR